MIPATATYESWNPTSRRNFGFTVKISIALATSEFNPPDFRSINPATAMKLNMVEERTTDGENPVMPANAQSESKMRIALIIRSDLDFDSGLNNDILQGRTFGPILTRLGFERVGFPLA